MRRLSASFAVIVAALALCLADAAAARDYGGGHGRWRQGGPPPGAVVGRGPGRWERAPMAPGPYSYGPPPGYGVRRGGYLPPQARGGVVQDYGRYRLRPPPPGYGWVRSGRSVMLMDMDTGQIFDVVPD